MQSETDRDRDPGREREREMEAAADRDRLRDRQGWTEANTVPDIIKLSQIGDRLSSIK